MPVKGKQFIDRTITQNKLNLIDPTLANDAATKKYADNNRSVELSSSSNKNMTANDTLNGVGDFPIAVNVAISDMPTTNTKVDVLINGEKARIGDGLDGYFSPDGIIIRERGEATQGDYLRWNKLGAKFNLDDTDKIDFNYLISVRSVI